jgi:hypothetical protein
MQNANGFEINFERGVPKHAKRNYAGLRPQTFLSGVKAGHSCLAVSHHFAAQCANLE